MVIFRMHASRYQPFDTSGAFLYGGRWHSRWTRVVYAAEHASLAVLETLIHAGGRKIPSRLLTQIEIPDSVPMETAAWMEPSASQAFGDAWVEQARSAVLRVPSVAVNRLESNFVLNPAHPAFSLIKTLDSAEFVFDPRFYPAAIR